MESVEEHNSDNQLYINTCRPHQQHVLKLKTASGNLENTELDIDELLDRFGAQLVAK